MLWMERLTLIFYVVINIFLFGFDFLISNIMGESLTIAEIRQIFILCAILSLLVWLLFRAIDYLFAGPLRREIRRQNNRSAIDQYQFR